jgi:arylsulfatase A
MSKTHPTRRQFLKALGAGATVLAFNTGTPCAAGPGAVDQPNFVVILADDMGYGDLACQNPQSKIPTPNLDRLARQGIRFTDAHAAASEGKGSRYGLLTGRYPWRAQLKQGAQRCWNAPVIEPQRLTIGKMLQQHGYDTACIGKWHLGMDWPTSDGKPPICVSRSRPRVKQTNVDFAQPIANGPTTRGFDYFFGVAATHVPPYCFIENEHTVGIPDQPRTGFPGCPGPMLEGWKPDDILPGLMTKAVAYLDAKSGKVPNNPFRQTKGKPFFLYVPLTAPRMPIAPSEPFQGKSQAGAYGDFVYQVDYVVGQVMRVIERNGFEKNTLVIFTSDNGSPGRDGKKMSGGYNSVQKLDHNPSYPWRGIKADIWEGGHRVPFLARWPGHIPAATTSDETICHIDLPATVAAILAEKLPNTAGEDSYNILPALLDKEYAAPLREATVHCSRNGFFALRQGKWKLIDQLGSGGFSRPNRVKPEFDGPLGQLYDLQADPGETKNLWLEHPEIVKNLTILLDKIKQKGQSQT